jgi:hypothetical protein
MILFLSQGIRTSLQIEEFEGLDYPEKSVNHVPERVLTISPVCTQPKNLKRLGNQFKGRLQSKIEY